MFTRAVFRAALVAASVASIPALAQTAPADPASAGYVVGGHVAVTNGDGSIFWAPLRNGQPVMAAPNGGAAPASQRMSADAPSTGGHFTTVTDGDSTRLVWVPAARSSRGLVGSSISGNRG